MASKRGRKPKMTEDIQKQICDCIETGMTVKAAVADLIDESTYYRYMNLGEQDFKDEKNTVYSEFYKSEKKAEKTFLEKHLKNIERASANSWQASAWLLERKYPNEFGKSAMEMKVSGTPGGEPVKTENSVVIYIPDNGRDKNDDEE